MDAWERHVPPQRDQIGANGRRRGTKAYVVRSAVCALIEGRRHFSRLMKRSPGRWAEQGGLRGYSSGAQRDPREPDALRPVASAD